MYKINKMYELENNLWSSGNRLYGVDEVGRGCMAGPVVVAAVQLNPYVFHDLLIDSKQLKPQQLVEMYDWLQDKCVFTIGVASSRVIDQHNIYQTTKQLMLHTILHLLQKTTVPKMIAIDAMPLNLNNTPYRNIEITSIIKGDNRSASIAAASILAKVTRDRIMQRLEQSFPHYGLAQHKGYCTKLHQETVRTYAPSIIHRTSYLSWLNKDQTHGQQSIFC